MDTLQALHLPEPFRTEVVQHYERFADRIGANFAGTALIPVYMPEGLNGQVTRGGSLREEVPASVATIDVPHVGGARKYLACDANTLLWAAHRYTVGFESWTHRQGDPMTPAYARILLVPHEGVHLQKLCDAAHMVCQAFGDCGVSVVLLTDGTEIAVWIPLQGELAYADLRASLHKFMTFVAEHSGGVLDPGTDYGAPVRISLRMNAPGLGTTLPYCVKAGHALRVLLPISENDLEGGLRQPHGVEAAASLSGDPFGDAVREIGPQPWPTPLKYFEAAIPVPMFAPRSVVTNAAIELLADGVPRRPDQILTELQHRGVQLPLHIGAREVAHDLIRYINSKLARGEKPLVIEDPDHRWFRINQTPDDWPAVEPAPPRSDPSALIEQLQNTAKGETPEQFEIAVCAAFDRLGFMATHVGGTGAPDGYFDAPLGPLGYRVMLECKTARRALARPDMYEAGKFREQYHAQHCVLVGSAFGDTNYIADEAKTHGIAVWDIDDLARVLRADFNVHQLRTLFEPGIVTDKMEDLFWESAHGHARRIRVVAAMIRTTAWNAQRRDARSGLPDQAPRLTVDAAMFLVNEALAAAGSERAATREEVEAAFVHMTDPLVGSAVRLDGMDSAIAVTGPP